MAGACATGLCGIGGSPYAGPAASTMGGDAHVDGACCDACGHAARRYASANPVQKVMMRGLGAGITRARTQRAGIGGSVLGGDLLPDVKPTGDPWGGGWSGGRRGIVMPLPPIALAGPLGPFVGQLTGAEVFARLGAGGYFAPQMSPAIFLRLLALPCPAWMKLSFADKLHNVQQTEYANPGAIGPTEDAWGQYATYVDRACRGQHGYAIGSSGELLAPSGDATFAPAGTTPVSYAYAPDGSGMSVGLDASGNPISGTVYDGNGNLTEDALWGDTATTYAQPAVPADQAGGLTPAQQQQVFGLAGQALGVLGSTIAAAITSGDTQQRQALNAQVQEALHADTIQLQAATDAATVAGLNARITALGTTSQLLTAPPPTSTTTKLVYGAVGLTVLGVGAKLLGLF